MDSPMPVPWSLVVKNALKMWSDCFGGSPPLMSVTEVSSWPLWVCDFIVSAPPAFMSFTASIPLSIKVHENLLQLHRVSHHPGRICRQFGPDRYGVSRCLAAQEDDYLSTDFVHINQLVLRSILVEEQANPADDFSRTGCVFSHSGRGFTRLFHIGRIARNPSQTGVSAGDGGGNRLIHFVRQRSSPRTHGGNAADRCEIRLRLVRRRFGANHLRGSPFHRR